MGNATYTAKRITSSLTIIDEGGMMPDVMALVEGKERAVLIDTANGSGDLAAFVATLTDKPLTLLLSHDHPDHVGGVEQFSDVRGILPDGAIVELGGVTLKTIAVPGHTPDSATYYCEAENWCFVSDAINPFVWMWLDGCLPITQYRESLLRFKSLVPEGTTLFCGHNVEPLSPTIVDDLLTICDELIAGKTLDNPPFNLPMPGMPPTDGAKMHSHNNTIIVYKEENIR